MQSKRDTATISQPHYQLRKAEEKDPGQKKREKESSLFLIDRINFFRIVFFFFLSVKRMVGDNANVRNLLRIKCSENTDLL